MASRDVQRMVAELQGQLGPDRPTEVRLWWHQAAMVRAPWLWPSVPVFFMVAGFGSGKSFTIVMLIIAIAARYDGMPVVCGIGTSTQTLLRKTVLADLFKVCAQFGVPFTYNSQEAILRMGTVQFISIPLQNPDTIYAYNFSAFICDELDELKQAKAVMVFTAVQERCRIPFPDGRLPFSMFMTTAQGLKGTYQIVTELQEKRVNHVLIRGRTQDNLSLPREYVRRLYALYNENERRAFLDGEFVNLTTGRVYYDYDELTCRLRPGEEFAIEPEYEVKVGQDLNAGFSRGSAVVKRDKTLYVVRCWSFGNIGHAPRLMRQAFPENAIYWYPDASGNEVINGYRAEIREQGIHLRSGSVNPSVVDRIFVVNKLFSTGRLKLFPGVEVNPLSMALKVRQYDDSGDPAKGKGAEAPDHYCFAAGTMVITDRGERSIETVKVGDMVLTRGGFRRVRVSGLTGVRPVIGCGPLSCTPDHPLFVGSGFAAAGLLTPKDTLCRLYVWERRLITLLSACSRAWSTVGIRVPRPERIVCTTGARMMARASDTCTGPFTRRPMGQFLAGSIFITSMAIHLIMRWTTWLRSLLPSIVCVTASISQSILGRLVIAICKRPVRRQRRGIAARRVGRGILCTLGSIRRRCAGIVEGASVAVDRFMAPIGMCSALVPVCRGPEGLQGLMTSAGRVWSAGMSSRSTDIAKSGAADGPVELAGVPVYNLSVEGDLHEFWANGVLVSNCDGLEYVVWRIVRSDRDFFDIYTATQTFRRGVQDPHKRAVM